MPAALRATVGLEVAEIEGSGAERLVKALRGLGAAASSMRTERGFRIGLTGSREAVVELAGSAPGIERFALRPATLEDVYFATHPELRMRPDMSSLSAMYGIIARDLTRTTRQKGRLLGGIARPFMWLLLVGTGFNAIARVEGGVSYSGLRLPRNHRDGGAVRRDADGDLDGLRPGVRHAAADAGEPGRCAGSPDRESSGRRDRRVPPGGRRAGAGPAFRAGFRPSMWPWPRARLPWDPS